MHLVKVSAVSLNTTPLDFSGNVKKIIQALSTNQCRDSEYILFPELCISGYGCEDSFFKESVWKRSWLALESLLPYTKNKVIIVGLVVFHGSFLYNCAAVLSNGKIIALIPKLNLANTGIHYERRWFHSPNEFLVDQYMPHYSENQTAVPFGHFLLEKDGVRFGLEICEDSWVTRRASHFYSEQGLDILFSPGASHFSLGKREIRHRIFQETSRTSQIITVFTNLCGNESGRAIFEGGSFFCMDGRVIKEGPRLFFGDSQVTSAAISLSQVRSLRAREKRSLPTKDSLSKIPILRLPSINTNPILLDHRQKEESHFDLPADLEKTTIFNDFTRAVSLGLYDYLRKSKTKGYTLSLSGGADSAACALLVDSMKQIAKKDVGDFVFHNLNIEESKLLVTLYQKTENNSPLTEKIAKLLTEELETEHHSIAIDESVSVAVHLIETTLQKKLSWKTDDLALQNIQARIRSPLIWLLANLNGHLLISTGNRSEASVGYTTMDGDSSGSLCPISGVSKEFILNWLDDIQAGNNAYISPKESLRLLRETKPTAELRPLSEKQEDEKDLMPYPLLQKIERYLVYLGIDEEECLLNLVTDFPSLTKDYLSTQITRFTKLFAAAQWKRERLPPSFHLDEYGLDPKSSYRYPILSGGF
ncbi:NAD(+) synthase [Leptospira ognonensis]|uniref:Glutamine-dependent NAD(+) synthetase n=1 Tax=Leptospira ognonensis TaxID=2484945 RepID=A0A4R9JYD3_9LEPT|nr:NAD(+) synthase [Leptospira ognonensis]TGL58241.1 NAD(+) synthase [Leptospira ognonensis]